MFVIIALVIAAILFALAAFGVSARVDLVALGLCALTLALLIPHLG